MRSDRSGCLIFTVDLGPRHEMQQYRFRCYCWGGLGQSESGLVGVFGDDPEMRESWVTKTIKIAR